MKHDLIKTKFSAEYLNELAKEMAISKKGDYVAKECSVLVFCGKFALDVNYCVGVERASPVHSIPNSNEILLGLTNVLGELQLCFDLKKLLGINFEKKRSIIIEKDKNRWVFFVDTVDGICHFDKPEVKEESENLYVKGFVEWHDRAINIIDEELLFKKLESVSCERI